MKGLAEEANHDKSYSRLMKKEAIHVAWNLGNAVVLYIHDSRGLDVGHPLIDVLYDQERREILRDVCPFSFQRGGF